MQNLQRTHCNCRETLILQEKDFVVQLIRSEPKKTTMKYLKERPRVFVPYQCDKITLELIKEACKTFFREHRPCVILTSEMRPSWYQTRPNSAFQKHCIFDFLFLKSLRMIFRQCRVNILVNIVNPIATQIYQKY